MRKMERAGALDESRIQLGKEVQQRSQMLKSIRSALGTGSEHQERSKLIKQINEVLAR